MATFVLVHGAWHGAWCWEKVIPLLQQQGQQVYAIDLLGHGADKTPCAEITLAHYVKQLGDFLGKIPEPVILVGHSMAGIIISQVSEHFPDKVIKLIYLSAFMPQNGESMLSLASQQPPSRFAKLMQHVPAQNILYLPLSTLRQFAYQCCSAGLFNSIFPRLCQEPLTPLTTPVILTETKYGQISRVYIHCDADNAIPLLFQQQMVVSSPCEYFHLASDHSPFYSMPENLTRLLLQSVEKI